MKKILILVVVLFAMISCNEQPDTNVYHEAEKTNDVYTVDGLRLRTIVIDSCEYLIGREFELSGDYGFGYLSHKGNCKYCAERRKQELQNLK